MEIVGKSPEFGEKPGFDRKCPELVEKSEIGGK
jgi:hypothetical protein